MIVGRIYLNLECFEARELKTPWYWGFSHPTLGGSAYGHVATRQAAMAALRAAWDQIEISRAS